MRIIKYLITSIAVILMCQSISAQEWGPMNFVYWENPPNAFPGFFNPSYCVIQSLLYFDTFQDDNKIYTSRLDSIVFDQWWWSDPVALPAPINIEDYSNVMPFITINGDSLFFCSNRPGSRGGMDIWMSVIIDNEWTEPVNLGNSVNTGLNESRPCYVPGSRILFFDRLVSRNEVNIYKSEFFQGSWQPAYELPEIVNLSDCMNYGAFYDEQEKEEKLL